MDRAENLIAYIKFKKKSTYLVPHWITTWAD